MIMFVKMNHPHKYKSKNSRSVCGESGPTQTLYIIADLIIHNYNQLPCALPLRDRGDPAGKVGGLTSTLSVTRTNQTRSVTRTSETSKSCCGEFLRCWVTPFTKVHYDLMSSGNQGGKLLIVNEVRKNALPIFSYSAHFSLLWRNRQA